jgi:hypothetical protein
MVAIMPRKRGCVDLSTLTPGVSGVLFMFSHIGSETMSDESERTTGVEAADEDVDAVIAEFGGDPRQAIRALLHDLAELAADSNAAISRGYVRGRLRPFQSRRAPGETQ